MERNESFAIGEIRRAQLKLTWAQADLLPTDGDAMQMVVAGDAESVAQLRVEQEDGTLTVAQPSLKYAKEILPRNRWLQICLRIPKTYAGAMDVDTVTGPVGVHGLGASDTSIVTVSGAINVHALTCPQVTLGTVSGAIAGTGIQAEKLILRSVSGNIAVDESVIGQTRLMTMSGDITLGLLAGSRKVDGQSVSGPVAIMAETPVRAKLHSLSGQFVMAEDVQSAQGEALEVSVKSVSGDLAVQRRAQG